MVRKQKCMLTALTLEEQLLLRNKLINAQSVCPLNQEQTTSLWHGWSSGRDVRGSLFLPLISLQHGFFTND